MTSNAHSGASRSGAYIGADHRLVWDMTPGTRLRAIHHLHMEEDPDEPRVFTAGEIYVVESMHPIANPPFVGIHNDFGEVHQMCATHLRAWFRRCC